MVERVRRDRHLLRTGLPGGIERLQQEPFADAKAKREEIKLRYEARYDKEKLIRVVDEAPWVSQIANRHHLEIGGFTMSADGRRVVVVATLDNLLKGAATQALQNVNRALGFDELTAIPL